MVSSKINWLIVALLALFAAFIRFRFNVVDNFVLIGGDGPYYPLEVRSIVENGHLAFPDMPLLFIIEGTIAKLLFALHLASLEQSTLLAVMWTDIILPPLAIIPVYFIAQKLMVDKTRFNLPIWLVIAFSILSFTPSCFFMTSNLQKNALATIWLFSYFYYLLAWLESAKKLDLYKLLACLFLCLCTHFGSFSLLLLYSLLAGLIWLIYTKSLKKAINIKIIGSILLIISILFGLLYLLDVQRFNRFFSLVFGVFDSPAILYILNGQAYIVGSAFPQMLFANILSLWAVYFFIKNSKKVNTHYKIMGWSLLLFTFILGFPFLNLGLARRLYPMTYVPITVLFLLIFNLLPSVSAGIWSKIAKIGLSLSFCLMLIISITPGLLDTRFKSITNEAYSELQSLKTSLPLTPNSLIISRQDLQLLSNWTLRTKGCAAYLLKKSEFKQYNGVYILRQIKGLNMDSIRFKSMTIPANTPLVFKGNYFEVYECTDSTVWKEGRGSTMKAYGNIIAIDKQRLTIKNSETNSIKTIDIDDKTVLNLANQTQTLQKGLFIEVWGSYQPFDLTIKAEVIVGEK